MACHNVCEVSQSLRCVTLGSDVNVNSAAPCSVAFRTRLAKSADKLLQGFHVCVGEYRGHHFALFTVRSVNAHVLLELPLSTLAVPCGVGIVTVAACGVLVSACSEELGGKLRGFCSCNVIHFNLDPYGLVHHFFNLLGGFFVHCGVLRLCISLSELPLGWRRPCRLLGATLQRPCCGRHILTLKRVYSKRFYHNILNEIHTLKLCISAMDFANYINTENSIQPGAVIPTDKQISCVIDPSNRTSCAYRRRLKIVH